MNKLLTLFAAMLVALTAVASTAEAGHHGRGLFKVMKVMRHLAHRHHHHHHHRPDIFVRRVHRPVVVVHEAAPRRIVRRVVTQPTYVQPEPQVEAETEVPQDVVEENSSIVTTDDVAEAKPAKARKVASQTKTNDVDADETPARTAYKGEDASSGPKRNVAAAGELGCKSFFPAVNMTLSVPCE